MTLDSFDSPALSLPNVRLYLRVETHSPAIYERWGVPAFSKVNSRDEKSEVCIKITHFHPLAPSFTIIKLVYSSALYIDSFVPIDCAANPCLPTSAVIYCNNSMDTSTSNGNAAAPTISVDLKLDSDEDNPRCLLKLPTGQLLAYGGDDGTISLVTFKGSKATATPVRRFDEEAVRALAVSPDGKRVAVGFDSGATQIYSYPDFEVSSSSSLHHPFLPELPDPDTTEEADEDNLFSQSDGLGGSLTVPGEKYFAGPCFDSPVRDLLFLPLSAGTGTNNYWLAAAWESGMCVLNATASATVTQRYLEEFAKEAYDEGGIRGLAFGSRNTNHTLTSLGMDGRLCLWDLSSDADHPEKWKLLRRENSCCVTKRDVGEVFGADAWDRSCRPHFVQSSENGLLAVPGATYLQLRKMSQTSPTAITTVTDHDQPVVGDDKDSPHQGHIESIVTMTSSPISDDPYIITSGRDGRVVVWEIQSDKVCGYGRKIGCRLSFRCGGVCCTVVPHILSLVSFCHCSGG